VHARQAEADGDAIEGGLFDAGRAKACGGGLLDGAQARAMPRPRPEGPLAPWASSVPSARARRTRVPVPPPSTPMRKSIIVVRKLVPGKVRAL
jgi:hypothetical protein